PRPGSPAGTRCPRHPSGRWSSRPGGIRPPLTPPVARPPQGRTRRRAGTEGESQRCRVSLPPRPSKPHLYHRPEIGRSLLWSLVATYIEENDHLDRTRVVVK